MRPTICFNGADAELQEVGEAVLRFLTVISEAHPEDVAVMLMVLDRYRPPADATSVDLATLMGTTEALRLRLQHGDRGEKPCPELVMFDVSGVRPN
jgi:hypothetical protein